MEIRYTKHSLTKFKDLKRHGFRITRSHVQKTIRKPEQEDTLNDFPNIIATGPLDLRHILRVVYRREGGKIIIITFYPGKRGRYL